MKGGASVCSATSSSHHRRGGRPVSLVWRAGISRWRLIGSIVTATVGAVVLLFLIGLIQERPEVSNRPK